MQKINKYIVGRGRGIDNIIFEGWIKKHGFKKIFRKAGNSRLAVGPLVIFKRQTSRAVDCEKL